MTAIADAAAPFIDRLAPPGFADRLRAELVRVPAADRDRIYWSAEVNEHGQMTFYGYVDDITVVDLLERPAGWVRRPFDTLTETMPPDAVQFLSEALDQLPIEYQCRIRWRIRLSDDGTVRVTAAV